MAENDSKEGLKLLQVSAPITACPTLKQTIMHDLWLNFEIMQDQLTDQDSLQYQLLEILNPLLFNLWLLTGERQ